MTEENKTGEIPNWQEAILLESSFEILVPPGFSFGDLDVYFDEDTDEISYSGDAMDWLLENSSLKDGAADDPIKMVVLMTIYIWHSVIHNKEKLPDMERLIELNSFRFEIEPPDMDEVAEVVLHRMKAYMVFDLRPLLSVLPVGGNA